MTALKSLMSHVRIEAMRYSKRTPLNKHLRLITLHTLASTTVTESSATQTRLRPTTEDRWHWQMLNILLHGLTLKSRNEENTQPASISMVIWHLGEHAAWLMLLRAIRLVFLFCPPPNRINPSPILTWQLARPRTGAYFSWQPVLPDMPGDKAQTVVIPSSDPTQTFCLG